MSAVIEDVIGGPKDGAVKRVLERIRRYVEHESPSGDVVRATALAGVIADDLRAAGAEVELIDAPSMGKHVLASVPGPRTPQYLLILAHLDTVHPVGSLRAMPYDERDGKASGPGIYDMKAGVALVIEALHLLRNQGRASASSVRVLVSCDEEVGSGTSRELIESLAKSAHTTLVVEPCLRGGAAKTARKGVAGYRIEAHGRAAHAGVEPERGISAITELALQVPVVLAIADAALGTTVNVGTMQGGTASNVIAAHAVAEIDVRYPTSAEAQRVDHAIRALQPLTAARLEITAHDSRPPLERSPGVVALFERAKGYAREMGHELQEGSTGGGSDGCLTAALGVPTLDGIGPDGGGAHAVDEHIRIDDLPFRLALFTRLIERL